MDIDRKSVFKVAICDDEKIFLDSIKPLLQEIFTENNISYSIEGFVHPQVLIQRVQQMPEAYDLVMLDIFMNEQNGIEIAKTLRKLEMNAIIVFVTVTKDFALKGYEVGAFRYLLKPVNKIQLKDILLRCYRKTYEKKENLLVFSLEGKIQRICQKEIEYIEVRGRGTVVYTKKAGIRTPYKISEMDKVLNSNSFIRCHQSFIVNLKYVDQIQRYEANLYTKNKVPISKTYYQKVKESFLNYLSDDD